MEPASTFPASKMPLSTLLLAALAAAALALPRVALAQDVAWALEPAPIDARSAAMGRTGVLMAQGSHGIFTNPALAAGLERYGLQLSGRASSGSIDSHLDPDQEGPLDESYPLSWAGTGLSLAGPASFLPGGTDFRFGWGLGFRSFLDMAHEYEMDAEDASESREVSGGFRTFTAALAMAYRDFLSVGVSFDHSLFASIEEQRKRTLRGETVRSDSETDLAGSFVTLGATVRLLPQLTLGATYRTTLLSEFDPEGPGEFAIGLAPLYALALAYRPIPSLVLVGEVQNRPYSHYQVLGGLVDLDDGRCYRLGLEWSGPVALRAGLFSDALPIADEGDDDPLPLLGVTGGIGVTFSGFFIDGALEYGRWARDYEEGSDYEEQLYAVRLAAGYTF